jgi:hemoglobin-like flavoprotein
MTAEQKRLVEDSYAGLQPVVDLIGDIFYSRLFELDPALKELFPFDMSGQSEKLTAAIGAAVSSLSCMDRLEVAMEHLGIRHTAYGVKPSHYDAVREALLWTLRMGLGPGFNVEIRQAWSEFYATLSNAMMRGAARQMISSS